MGDTGPGCHPDGPHHRRPSGRRWRRWAVACDVPREASRKGRNGREGEWVGSRKRTQGTQRARGDREVAVWNQGSWGALPTRERGLKPRRRSTSHPSSATFAFLACGVPREASRKGRNGRKGERMESRKRTRREHREHGEAGEVPLRGKADGALRRVLSALPPPHAPDRPRATWATPAWSASRPPAMTIRPPFHHTPCQRDLPRARRRWSSTSVFPSPGATPGLPLPEPTLPPARYDPSHSPTHSFQVVLPSDARNTFRKDSPASPSRAQPLRSTGECS